MISTSATAPFYITLIITGDNYTMICRDSTQYAVVPGKLYQFWTKFKP